METLKLKTETALVKINASEYGLEESKASEIEALFLPMLSKMSELENEYNDILQNEINPETCQRAKDLRLSYVKIRTGTAEIHRKAKEFYLNGGRFVDGWKNAQLFASGEKEKTLKAIEDHFENQERERLEKLRADRLELLKPYTEIEPLALGHMEQDVFDNYLVGIRGAYLTRIAAEKKADEDRIAAIEAERVRQENIRIENEKLKAAAIERDKEFQAEKEKIQRVNAERERLNEIERKKQAKILTDQKEKADKERAELLAKAEVERKEKERLEKELAAKIAATEKLKRDAELKLQAEQKVKAAAEKKAHTAPDKAKLLAFGQALNDVPRPEIKSIEAAEIMANINGLLVKLNNYIIENANKL
jgi:hypothetical protein